MVLECRKIEKKVQFQIEIATEELKMWKNKVEKRESFCFLLNIFNLRRVDTRQAAREAKLEKLKTRETISHYYL